jgi:hypothetical protein
MRATRFAFVAVFACLIAGCGGTSHGPLAPPCGGRGEESRGECKETSDGFLVTPAYYETLQTEERTNGVPHVRGETPAKPEERDPATPAPMGEKPSANGTPTETGH